MEKLVILNRGYSTQTYTFNELCEEINDDESIQFKKQ